MKSLEGGRWMRTYRGLIRYSMGLDIYCNPGSGCGRNLDADIYDAAAIVGLDGRCIGARLPMRCRACGSWDVRYKLHPDVRHANDREVPHMMRASRTPAERAAVLAMVEECRQERPAG